MKLLLYITLFSIVGVMQAQEPIGVPATKSGTATSDSSAASNPDNSEMQSKRIAGILPNFRAVSTNTKLPPQSVKEKFKIGFDDSFDYSSFIFIGIQAAISQKTNSYPYFQQGAAGYGRYYWHTFADQVDENFWVESIIPSALHEDNRYYTLGHGNFFKRLGYALSRSVVTRNDAGENTINLAEIVGSGAASGISNAYYPGQYRTWTKTQQRWVISFFSDSGSFVVKEFWPDINRTIFHHRNSNSN